MFERLNLRGQSATLLWGYRTAAEFRAWTIQKAPRRDAQGRREPGKGPGRWVLSARVARADAFACRQRDLYFTAPRDGGFWCWPVKGDVQVAGGLLKAVLGAPEQ